MAHISHDHGSCGKSEVNTERVNLRPRHGWVIDERALSLRKVGGLWFPISKRWRCCQFRQGRFRVDQRGLCSVPLFDFKMLIRKAWSIRDQPI